MKLLVVDDEPLARQRLCRMLRARNPADDIREAVDGLEALELNRLFEPDVVLLDIRMPGMDGIEAARHMGQAEHPPAIVFCTAYDEYAIAAFESRAVGYLLKPVQQEKLEAALAAAAATSRYQLRALAQASRQERHCLSSRSSSGTRLLEVAEVRVLLADQKYVSAIHPGGSLLLDESLRELEEEFGERFLRVHRNALVARAWVRALHREGAGEWVLDLDGVDTRAVVSRRHLAEVRAALERL
jgi:two-component system response regulator AlgR